MDPKYSILLCNKALPDFIDKISKWLFEGIKVIWFGNEQDVKDLKSQYADFTNAFLLLAYVTSVSESGIVVDGEGNKALLYAISQDCSQFNYAQYCVEHCEYDANIEVQASAGTGKTTVMIDRIMYLIHTRPELRLSEIFMITFTNDAAQQMSSRLQDVLTTRFSLTGNERYMRWVEEQSQMNISTIHSFAYFLLKRLGIGEGFTKGLSIRSFEYEKKELIKDSIDKRIDDKKRVKEQLGIPFYRANSIVGDYWGKFAQLGVSHTDLGQMDWGEPENQNSVNFHKIIKDMVSELDDKYFELKRKEEAISINDIMRDLQEVLVNNELPQTDLSIKYLFIDEFQDSDLSQIKVACLLSKIMGAILFVVGDIKQSIYRFRGATDKAFEIFHKDIKDMGLKQPMVFNLINNYRTAAGVLSSMDGYFFAWARKGVLTYDKAVVPFNMNRGKIKMIPSKEKKTDPRQVAEIVSFELDALVKKVKASGKKPNEKNRVVILTRSNRELSEIAVILRNAKIPASVSRDGAFYASEAVRDFYMMVSSFMFCDEPKYIFNYLLTPYAGDIEPMNINYMERLSGDYESLCDYLVHFLDQTSWKRYHRELRLRPVMSVFKEMLDEESIIDHYISNNRARRDAEGWEEARRDAETLTSARQYQANLEKLMEILQNNLGGDKVSLYDVYNFLKINVATNRSESDAKVQSKDDYTSVLCMTVHKSKGLEFDTVIIPFTDENFGGWAQTELLVDPIDKKVGWNYTGDKEKTKRRYKYPPMKSSFYDDIQKAERDSGVREGVRLLYVGMTRAIDTLICIVEETKNPMSWAKLIEEVGVDYE